MNHEQRPAPRAGSSPANLTRNPSERLQQVAKLFAASYAQLLAFASEGAHISARDGGCIIDGLERRLNQYSGPSDPDSFREWAQSIIEPIRSLHALMNQYTGSVKKGIWSVLKTATDLGIDDQLVETLVVDSWTHVSLNLDQFLIPGTAGYSTRLFHVGANRAKAWKTQKLRDRKRFTDFSVADKFEAGYFVGPPEDAHHNMIAGKIWGIFDYGVLAPGTGSLNRERTEPSDLREQRTERQRQQHNELLHRS
jgi:hypothetical protein